MELAFNQPGVVIHVVHVQVLVGIVPADNVQKVVVVEDVVRERSDLGQAWVPLHQVLLYVETEALLGADCFVEASEDENSLAVDWHAHRQVTGCPRRLRV